MRLLRYLIQKFGKPILLIYLRFPVGWRYGELKLRILPGVFHPGFFFSSRYLADFVSKLDLKGKIISEPCCGSGLISLVAFQKGARVYAGDLSSLAVKNTYLNFRKNFEDSIHASSFSVVESDVFNRMESIEFELVFVNPPYFFKSRDLLSQWAWNAGENGEFFVSFFEQLKNRLKQGGEAYMVLADNCEIERILEIARNSGFQFLLKEQKKILWEHNFIYQISRTHEVLQ